MPTATRRRVLLKLSGEAFGGGALGVNPDVVSSLAREIARAAEDVEVVQASINERPEVLGALIHAAQRADLPHLTKAP